MKDNLIANKIFDFALTINELYMQLKKLNEFIIPKQIIRSGTSIAANIEEAIAAQSKKDFISKLSIASKEARETKYWLRLLHKSELTQIKFETYLAENEQIINIITKIIKTSQEAK
jgi:four helix bundle protein